MQKIIFSEHFCSFCALESHVQGILKMRNEGQKAVIPLSIILFIKKVGNGMFEVGR